MAGGAIHRPHARSLCVLLFSDEIASRELPLARLLPGSFVSVLFCFPMASDLAFTGYCHFQYCKIYAAIQEGRGDILYCAIEWVTKAGSGAPKRRDDCKEYD